MSSEALESEVITEIRATVPEYEELFQATLRDEGRGFGSFQAMSDFAAWLLGRMNEPEWEPAVQRSFAVIEHIAGSRRFRMGSALVAEFVEAIASNADARSRMGPHTRAHLGPP